MEPQPYRPTPYYIENDWSAASYWYEMMALTPDKDAEIILTGLFADSAQGDSAVHGLFEPIGVHTEFFCDDDGMPCVKLTKQPIATERLEYDFVNQPDLAQTFVVTCAMLGIPFRFTGLQSLKIKETDRISRLSANWKNWGIPCMKPADQNYSGTGNALKSGHIRPSTPRRPSHGHGVRTLLFRRSRNIY